MQNEDMIAEIASEQVNEVVALAKGDEYEKIHRWLQPIFIEKLVLHVREDDVAEIYEDFFGKGE